MPDATLPTHVAVTGGGEDGERKSFGQVRQMTNRPRPLALTTLAGSAWLMATIAQAGAAPDAAPELLLPGTTPAGEGEIAEAGSSAGAAEVQIAAVPPVTPDRWSFTVAPYLWMAGVKSSTTFSPRGAGRTIEANVDRDFTDILKDLNFAIMAGAEARRGRFSAQTDAIYMNILQKGSRVRSVTGPLGRELPTDLGDKLKLESTVWTLSAGYDVFRDDHGFVQLFGGVRYLGARSTLDWNFEGPLGDLSRSGRVKSQADIWNGIAGLRGERALGEGRWKAVYYVDVGAGDSKLTWQALAQLAYAERWGDIGIGWRYLDFQQSSGKATADFTMSGPILTLRYRFGG